MRDVCIYCLRSSQSLTKDHVFPRSWYPDSTPVGTYKWTVPCCKECNNKYSRLEEDFLLRFAICLSPADATAAGVPERAMRSIDPDSARNERDRAARARKRKRLLENVHKTWDTPESTMPGFEAPDSLLVTPKLAVVSSIDDFKTIGSKLARGLTFALYGQLIHDDYIVESYAPVSKEDVEFDIMMKKFGEKHHSGPGVEVLEAVPKDEPKAHAFRFLLWGRLKIYATVTKAADSL